MLKEKSCGTVIFHQKDDYTYLFLLIKQHNTYHWGFPKGHQERFEEDSDTAKREAFEETGLKVKLFYHIKDLVSYQSKPNVSKDVIYYLAKAPHQNVLIQVEEILDHQWLSYEDTLKKLTYENDKHVFINIVHQAKEKQVFMNPRLKYYIEDYVLPQYKQLDEGHQLDHIQKVIDESLDYARHFEVYHHMVYTIASYHDIGMIDGREFHHITGADRLANDIKLKQWFNEDQINTMKQAIIDHRASQKNPPQTIYGQIIAQADRDLDLDTILKRIIAFGKATRPEISTEIFFEKSYEHLEQKYGKNGYMSLWIKTEEVLQKIKELQDLIEQKDDIYTRFLTLYQENE